MEKKEASEKKENGVPQKEKLYLAIIGVLVVLCGFLTWMAFDNRTTVENISLYNENLQQDKQALNDELSEMLSEYNNLETDNENLKSEILDQKTRIEDLQDKIEKSKGNLVLIRKYKREVTTLRTIMKGYVVTIDSLNTMNQELITENTSIKRELSSSQEQNSKLSSDKKNLEGIVKKASMLRTYNIVFEGLRLRNSGKQVETNNAEKVEILKVCCDIEENLTTKPGEKVVYVQVFDPNGEMLVEASDGKNVVPLNYTSKREIEYENKQMNLCVYTNLNGIVMLEGDYTVKIFEAGDMIGSAVTTFK